MKYEICPLESQLIEYLLFPSFYYFDLGNESFLDFKDLFLDVAEDIGAMKKQLEPYKDRIQKWFLKSINHYYFPEYLYYEILDQGKSPQNLEEVFEAWEKLSLDEVKQVFYRSMGISEKVTDTNFFEKLDDASDDVSLKWQWNWMFHHLDELVPNLIQLYRDLGSLYEPYFEKYREERQAFAEDFDIDKIKLGSETMRIVVQDTLASLEKETCHVHVMSPLFQGVSLYGDDNNKATPVYLDIYARYNVVIETSPQRKQKSTLQALRLLGDENRYNVLKEVGATNQKSKDIAKKLGLTPANVSFHTQKLVDNQLLTFNTNTAEGKYRIDKSVLRSIIAFLEKDLDL